MATDTVDGVFGLATDTVDGVLRLVINTVVGVFKLVSQCNLYFYLTQPATHHKICPFETLKAAYPINNSLSYQPGRNLAELKP